jgi:hypothetical protein
MNLTELQSIFVYLWASRAHPPQARCAGLRRREHGPADHAAAGRGAVCGRADDAAVLRRGLPRGAEGRARAGAHEGGPLSSRARLACGLLCRGNIFMG